MKAEIINVFFFSDTKSIARMWEDSLTQPCVIIANLQNILGIRLEDVYHVSCYVSSRVPVLEFRLKHANNENILCNRGLAQENQQRRCNGPLCWEFQHKYANTENVLKTHKLLQWLGFPAHAMLVFKILDCVHWEFQWVKAIHEKLCETRWCLEVWNKKFFVFCHCMPNIKRFIGSSNVIVQVLKTFSKFSLTGSKQMYSTHSIYREQVQTWSDLCFKLEGRWQS